MRHTRVCRRFAAGLILASLGCAASGRNPVVTEASPEKSVKPGINDGFKNVDDVDEWIGRFEVESREVFTHRRKIVAAARVAPGTDVADVGAGTGAFVAVLSEAVGPKGTVHAVDIAPKFLEHIRERAAKAGLKNVRTLRCTERSVELPANSVDLVFTCDVYHHFEYPQSTLRTIRRALRRGGHLVIVDFDRIEGKSREWTLNHVRAGKETVIEEITAAGFTLVDDGAAYDFLDENYIIRFRRSD